MQPPPFRRVLVANRGEIAIRICRTLREMGIESVAVHCDVDADAAHVLAADRALNLGGADASSSYLQVPKLLDAGCIAECDAVHPGYGFLSEDANFVRALEAVGMAFIGPEPEAMEILGSKSRAKEAAIAAEVPVIPGSAKDTGDDRALLAEARKIGFPVLIKASDGGGGKGMRLVREERAFLEELAACRRESQAAFHSQEMLLEKFLDPARHVEIQVLGDKHGDVRALGERECSVQRRHQKVVEEAPSPVVGADLRRRMGDAAVRLSKRVGYHNAGTVEFLLDGEGRFWFLEVNTRLQVEHPVTELVTGLDLVRLQVEIAGGASLGDLLGDRDLSPRGHAIEVRVYAECPEQGFLPAAGRLTKVIEPRGPGIRVDSGVHTGSTIGVQFDPMVAKIIVHGPDRESARRRMAEALRQTVYLGIPTNRDFLERVVRDAEFREGRFGISWLDRRPDLAAGPGGAPPDAAYVAALLCRALDDGPRGNGNAAAAQAGDVWQELGALRMWGRS